MKTIINFALLLAALTLTLPAIAQNDADPKINSFGFSGAPIPVGQTRKLQVFFSNNAFTSSLHANNVGILVSLPASPSYAASPMSAAAVSGVFASNFTWTYNPAPDNSFIGILNTTIAPGAGGLIEFTVIGVTPTGGTPVQSTVNIVRLNPADYPNENVANNLLNTSAAVSPAPLPVNMSSFVATKNNCEANISWITVNEDNTSHFEVEASNDGKSFKAIGSVKAAGKSADNKYYTYQYQMQSDIEYFFRLKMVDLNGTFDYSPVAKLSCGNIVKQDLNIAPNPVVNIAHVSGMENGKNTITIFDLKGRKLQSVTTEAAAADLDVALLVPGIYTIRVQQENGEVVTKKLVKQ